MSSKHPDDPDLAAISPDLAEPKSFISETEMAEILDPFKEWHPYFMEALYHPKWKWIDTAFTWIQVKCYIRREQVNLELLLIDIIDPMWSTYRL